MKEINKKIKYIISGLCFGILILFMLMIGIRFFTVHVLIKRMGMDNSFTRGVCYDNEAVFNENNENKKVYIDWNKLYPLEEKINYDSSRRFNCLSKYQEKILALEEKINAYTKEYLAGQKLITEANCVYKNLIHWKYGASGAEKNSTIIYMKNSYLTFQHPKVAEKDMEEVADSVKDFSNYLDSKGIPFLYVNAGSKVNPGNKQLSAYDETLEYTNENGNALQVALDKRNIIYLDMRKEMMKADLDWYDAYYITDHHWKTETQLWAAGIIANKLNEIADMRFDSYYFGEEAYEFTRHKNLMFGPQGEIATHINAKPEEFTTIFPIFDTDFSVEIPTNSYRRQGDYKTTLFDLSLLERGLNSDNEKYIYYCARWQNDALGIIKNNNAPNNKNKKILVLQDSFGWYLTTYLACDVGEIDIINPVQFNGSIKAYVEAVSPDAVVVLYCERDIEKIDWNTHESRYDFR